MLTIDDLFNVEYGQRELTSKEGLANGDTIVISSQGTDNGCYGFFSFDPYYNPPFITVPRTGSIGEAFVQEFPCAVTDDLLVLQPKKKMKIEELYYVAALIRQEKWRYNYGRKITPDRLKPLKVDFSKMDLQKTRAVRQALLNKIRTFEQELRVKPQRKTKQKTTLGQLFHINYGQREINSKEHLKPGGTLVISSQGVNNGCYGFFDIQAKYRTPVISVPRTGSIGLAFVQEYPCCIDDNCLVLSPKEGIEISSEEMYFVAALIRLDSWRYRYGRQVTDIRLSSLEIDFSKWDFSRTKSLRDRVQSIL
jgi:hypothetical protein